MDFDKALKSNKNRNIAVRDRNKSWQYGDFYEHTTYAKEFFITNKTSKVCICLEQGFLAYTLIWGCFLAGVTFCPINIGSPLDRKKLYIEKFAPDIILCESGDELLSLQEIHTIEVDDFFRSINDFVPLNPPPESSSEIAYVIFTSGSTGLPKGVMVKRVGLENFLKWSTSEYRVSNEDVWGQYSNLGFDLSIADIFTAILCGATLVPIAAPGEKLLPGKMIEKYGITFWHSVPSIVDLMDKYGHINKHMLRTLKIMTFCGEKLFPSQLEKLFTAKPDLVVYNTYGPTEITIFCTAIKLDALNYKDYSENTVSIGKALPGWDVQLVNMVNGIGEIVVYGDNIAKGYLDDPDTIDSPFQVEETSGVIKRKYHTGDYAQYINNDLYFVGRKDTQIKVMGHRVDLSEIDYFLREYGCVSCVSAFDNNKIISFVICENYNEESLRKFLSNKLPAYYMPQHIVQLTEFPKNSSGKTDVKALVGSLRKDFGHK